MFASLSTYSCFFLMEMAAREGVQEGYIISREVFMTRADALMLGANVKE